MNYRWKCTRCDVAVEINRPVSECAVPPGEEFSCMCEPWEEIQWQRIYEAPMQLRASFPDGHKRKGWAELRESAKLEKLAAVSDAGTKKEIKDTIRQMGIKPGKD